MHMSHCSRTICKQANCQIRSIKPSCRYKGYQEKTWQQKVTSLEPGKDKATSVNPQREVDLILKAVRKAKMKGRA